MKERYAPAEQSLYDKSLIDRDVARNDVTTVAVDATEIATEDGKAGMANMIMLGAFLKATGLFTLDEIRLGVEKTVPASKKHLIEVNMK